MEDLERIGAELARTDTVLIASHLVPDGDSLGSAIALSLGLASLGIKTYHVSGDPVPEIYQYLKGSDAVLHPSGLPAPPDTIVLVDCTDPERAGNEVLSFTKRAKLIINIDHHVSNTGFGHLKSIRPEASAVGEMVFRLLSLMNVKITPDIATALYTAIVTDTGSFQYENSTAATLRLTADLIEYGADVATARYNLWERKPLASILLLQAVLPSLKVEHDGRIAYIALDKKSAEALHVNSEHTEGLINYPRSIDGVEVAIFFREIEPDLIKVGLRSKKEVDVDRLAGLFGGGGHRRAAGCLIKGNMAEAVSKVVASTVCAIDETPSGGSEGCKKSGQP